MKIQINLTNIKILNNIGEKPLLFYLKNIDFSLIVSFSIFSQNYGESIIKIENSNNNGFMNFSHNIIYNNTMINSISLSNIKSTYFNNIKCINNNINMFNEYSEELEFSSCFLFNTNEFIQIIMLKIINCTSYSNSAGLIFLSNLPYSFSNPQQVL